jgi:hypothetical protein
VSARAVLAQPTKLRPVPAARPEPDFVEFWTTGSQAIGIFACAACGRTIRSVRQLPDCPSCGGRLWELATTSPFRGELASVQLAPPELDTWHDQELESTAGLVRGVVVGLLLAPLCWLLPIAVGLAVYALLG